MQKHPPSPADEADRRATERAVEFMIGVLNGWDHTRPLGSLNKNDLRRLGVAAISGFIIQRASERLPCDQFSGDLITDATFAG